MTQKFNLIKLTVFPKSFPSLNQELPTFYYDQMRGEVNAPGQGGGCDEDLNLLVHEELLHRLAIALDKARVVHPDAEGEEQPGVEGKCYHI